MTLVRSPSFYDFKLDDCEVHWVLLKFLKSQVILNVLLSCLRLCPQFSIKPFTILLVV